MNQYDDLIDEIARRVMSSLNKNNENDSSTNMKNNHLQAKTYAIIGENSYVKGYYEKQNFRLNNDYTNSLADVLVIAEVNLNSIPRLSNLISITQEEEAILNHLLNNKQVVLLSEATQGIDKNENKQFKSIYKKHLNDFTKLGVQVLNVSHFTDKPVSEKQGQKSVKKKLITLKSVQDLQLEAGETFLIESNAIVTALAKDYLNDLSIEVERRGIS